MTRLLKLGWVVLLAVCLGPGCGKGTKGPKDEGVRPDDGSVQIEAHIHRIVAKQLSVDVSELRNSHSLRGDLKCDDLDIVELVMSVEDEFGISIPDADAESFKTIGDVVTYVRRRLPPPNG